MWKKNFVKFPIVERKQQREIENSSKLISFQLFYRIPQHSFDPFFFLIDENDDVS